MQIGKLMVMGGEQVPDFVIGKVNKPAIDGKIQVIAYLSSQVLFIYTVVKMLNLGLINILITLKLMLAQMIYQLKRQ